MLRLFIPCYFESESKLGAALAKAAAARFVRDDMDDGLPLRVVWERRAPGSAGLKQGFPRTLPVRNGPQDTLPRCRSRNASVRAK